MEKKVSNLKKISEKFQKKFGVFEIFKNLENWKFVRIFFFGFFSFISFIFNFSRQKPILFYLKLQKKNIKLPQFKFFSN